MCKFNSGSPEFRLRGLNENSPYDEVYKLEKDGVNRPWFKGESSSIIKWVSL